MSALEEEEINTEEVEEVEEEEEIIDPVLITEAGLN